MDPLVRHQIERIHSASTKVVVATAGGGTQLLNWLLILPGSSHTVLEIQVPYSTEAITEFLGATPDQSVSQKTAIQMARVAYQKANRLDQEADHLVGIGCTAAISTNRPKRGSHRCHVAAWTKDHVKTYSVTLIKESRGREREDEVVSRLALRALSEACGIEWDMASGLEKIEKTKVATFPHNNAHLIDKLLSGTVQTVVVQADGTAIANDPVVGGILPGSFNPLHEGHEHLATVAQSLLDSKVTYELSTANVDKPPLGQSEVQERLSQFAGKAPVALTSAATFREKCVLFPDCTFIIGWDTATRLVDIRYYGGDESTMLKTLELIERRHCQFLVAGRIKEGVFHTLADVTVPDRFKGMFQGIPEASFRADFSSTDLRTSDY